MSFLAKCLQFDVQRPRERLGQGSQSRTVGCICDTKIMRCKKLMIHGSTLLVCAYSARFVLVQHNQHVLAEHKHWKACKRYNMGPPSQPSWFIAPKATVYDTYDLILTTIVNGDYSSTWNWEAPHCRRSARTAINSTRSLQTIARRAANDHSLTALPICQKDPIEIYTLFELFWLERKVRGP